MKVRRNLASNELLQESRDKMREASTLLYAAIASIDNYAPLEAGTYAMDAAVLLRDAHKARVIALGGVK